MRTAYYIFILLTAFCGSVICTQQLHAQQKSFYNYNIYNGLPSNHVYKVIVDKYGYVWIASAKGVIRYNGYSFRKFDEEDGIENADIWNLVEDKNGRIWLGAISPKFGYIKNNKYKIAYQRTETRPIYPTQMQATAEGLSYIENIQLVKGIHTGHQRVYFDKDATPHMMVTHFNALAPHSSTMDEQGNMYVLQKEGVLCVGGVDGKKINSIKNKLSSPYSIVDSAIVVKYNSNFWFIATHSDPGMLVLVGIKTGKVVYLRIPLAKQENLISVHQFGRDHYITTNKTIRVYDSLLRLQKVYTINSLLPPVDTASAALVWFCPDKDWGGFTTTSNMGFYQHFAPVLFNKTNIVNIDGAEYKGTGSCATQYWVNKVKREVIMIRGGKVHNRDNNPNLLWLNSVAPFVKDTSLLCSREGLYKLCEANGILTSYFKDVKYVHFPQWSDSILTSPISLEKVKKEPFTSLIYKNRDTLYAKVMRHNITKLYWNTDTMCDRLEFAEVGTYTETDTLHKVFWTDNANGLSQWHLGKKKIDTIDEAALKQLGIHGLKRFKVDKRNGNLFLLCADKLLQLDVRKRVLKKLDFSFNPSGCEMQMEGENLVLLNSFGLVMYKVKEDGSVSAPYYAINHKYHYYKFIYGKRFAVDDSIVSFNTDKGFYRVRIPDKLLFGKENSTIQYRVLVSYNDSLTMIRNRDTVIVDQGNGLLGFDVINPEGVGNVRMHIYVDGVDTAWQVLNGNNWLAGGFAPDKYHTVYVRPMDDGWMGAPVVLIVYIKPFWWQTYVGKVAIGFIILTLFGGIVWVAALITRRRTNRINASKNLQAELKSLRTSMELKSIHAQINPHFIFNTLSTGLYFIKKNKMEDAYDHISAFSQLLRNYIKSSRDKYITLYEEIDNLKRYVSLQQTRFENLHEFDIEIAEGVNIYTEKIPALLLQPLVENAINHGLFHKSTPGRLLLRFEHKTDDTLICIIDDDGVGRERAKEINAETTHKTQSYGTDLVKELIETFNKYEPIHIVIEYIDKIPPQSGTTVVLTLKQFPDDK